MQSLKKVLSIIVLIILLPVLIVNSVILINSIRNPNEIPSFFGWKPFIVLSGSMESEIFPGDLVIVKEVDPSQLKEQDVIAFKEDNIVITHRIIEIVENNGVKKYITKGDNNNVKDNGFVLEKQIEGLYQFKISGLGNLAVFIQTPIGMIVSLSIPILMLILVQMSEKKKLQNEKNKKEQSLEKEIEKLKREKEELMKK